MKNDENCPPEEQPRAELLATEQRRDPKPRQSHLHSKSRHAEYLSRGKENRVSTESDNCAQSKEGLRSFKDLGSPDRPTNNVLAGLRSNKAKDGPRGGVISSFEPNNPIIFEGLSKDGRYRIVSRCLEGEELDSAVEFELKANAKTRKQSEREVRNGVTSELPQMSRARVASKEHSQIKSYGVNTHEGISRSYNEDRVSIILNILKGGVNSTYFGVYDGHGGSGCCDFLNDNLHEAIISHKSFPNDPKRAIGEGLLQCEKRFLALAQDPQAKRLDRSGSCVIVALLVEDECYLANLGDSRAVISLERGKLAYNLSRDHKPTDLKEQKRVLANGGRIYRTEMNLVEENGETIIGPLRVFPGRLSVTRTLGDAEAKLPEFGGTRNCISVEAEIRKFRLLGKEDFIFLASDGVFERLQSGEVVRLIWDTIRRNPSKNLHELCGLCVDTILSEAMLRKTTDNLTGIMICLNDFTNKETDVANYASI